MVGAGSAGAVLAARLSRGSRGPGAAAGGGARGRGRRDVDPGCLPGPVQDEVGLELLHDRAEAAARPAGLLAADEGARRLLVDERDDLHPRQPLPTTTPGATSTAPTAGATTTCCRTSSGPRATPASVAVPRPGRAAARRGPPLHPRADHRRSERGQPGIKRNDDFNGAAQEGAGLYQVTCSNGRRWSVTRLTPVRPGPPQPRRRDPHLGHQGRAGRLPGNRREVSNRTGPSTPWRRPPRSAGVRGRDQQPAAADALGDRPRHAPARARHRRRRRPPRRRPASRTTRPCR